MPRNDFLAMMLKLTKVQKKKILNLEFIRIEIFCVSKEIFKNSKDNKEK